MPKKLPKKRPQKSNSPFSHIPVPGNEKGTNPLMPKSTKVPGEDINWDGLSEVERIEMRVSQVEILMAKGIRERRVLMVLLDVHDPRTMENYIRRVHARWEVYGSQQHLSRNRGELLQRYDMIEQELWATISNTDSTKDKISGLKNLLVLQQQRADMQGLSKDAVLRILQAEGAESINMSDVNAEHNAMAKIAMTILNTIKEKQVKVIEHEPSDS